MHGTAGRQKALLFKKGMSYPGIVIGTAGCNVRGVSLQESCNLDLEVGTVQRVTMQVWARDQM